MLHGKRIQIDMNLAVFPTGYLKALKRKSKPIESLKIVYQNKRGVNNGPATIFVNKKKVCETVFSDQVEFVRSNRHPIGRENLIGSD